MFYFYLIVDISITKRVLFGLGKAMARVAIPRYYDKNEQDGYDGFLIQPNLCRQRFLMSVSLSIHVVLSILNRLQR